MYTREYLNKFRLGADPEFAALGPGNVYHIAEGVIPREGSIGYDHAGYVLEMTAMPLG